MPNKPSTIKRVRQAVKQRAHNRQLRSSLRSTVKKANVAIENKSENVGDALKAAQSKLAKAAKTRIIKKNTMARTQSRLMKAANKAKKSAE